MPHFTLFFLDPLMKQRLPTVSDSLFPQSISSERYSEPHSSGLTSLSNLCNIYHRQSYRKEPGCCLPDPAPEKHLLFRVSYVCWVF